MQVVFELGQSSYALASGEHDIADSCKQVLRATRQDLAAAYWVKH
jgi:hypothetical protein